MFGIKIQDSRPGGGPLSFGLADVLKVIGEPALSSEWRCLNLRYIGRKNETWDEFREKRKRFSGKDFVDFAALVGQVIDGEFIAKKHGSNKAWLIIKAVDSSWFEVWSSKQKVLEEMKSRFVMVSPLLSTIEYE
jgi:hypothetical protein